MWCIAEIDNEYRTCMYDVLDLYEESYDSKRPIICLDEKPKQLIDDKRNPIPMKQGSPKKYDYEYKRNGKVNIFVSCRFQRWHTRCNCNRSKNQKGFCTIYKTYP